MQSAKNLLTRAEASTKGFVITDDRNDLASCALASEELRAKVQDLRQLTADNAAQLPRLNLLESLADDAIRAFQDEVNARPNRTLAAASSCPWRGRCRRPRTMLNP